MKVLIQLTTDVLPIFASLRKHCIMSLLIAFEIALACAVMCNAIFMISQNMSSIHLPNAIDEQGITIATLSGSNQVTSAGDIARDLDALRNIDGVKEVATSSSIPLDNSGLEYSFGVAPDAKVTDVDNVDMEYYLLGEGAEKAFGLQLLQGRFFNKNEYTDSTLGPELLPTGHVAIITKSLAERLWPGQPALGKVLYAKPLWYTVIGVVADVLCPDNGAQGNGNRGIYYSIFFPISPSSALGYLGPSTSLNHYVLRSKPEDRERIGRQAEQKLSELYPTALAKSQTFSDIRDEYFADASNLVWTLILVCSVMLIVTAFGIFGLSSFWVQQRKRQIGVRRALGATRLNILRYFLLENFLLSTIGVGLGLLASVGINLILMQHYEMGRMPWYYLPVGAVLLWLIGQIAVLKPSLRAASVPPVAAIRSS